MATKDIALNARNSAIDYLSRREHGVEELRHKLKLKFDNNPEVVDEVLQQLQDENLLSEARYVEQLIRSKQNRGFGPLAIQMHLRDKGVAANVIENYLDVNDDEWRQQACDYRIKKFGQSAPKDFKDKAKQIRHLQYKGFTQSQIDFALKVFE